VAWAQFLLPFQVPRQPRQPDTMHAPDVEETVAGVVVRGSDFCLTFDRGTGAISEWQHLASPERRSG